MNEDGFRRLGNEILKRKRQVASATEMIRFRATFGATPKIILTAWNLILSMTELMKGAKPVHLLWALMFMKLYCSEPVLATLAGAVHEQTFRKWSWYFVEQIANLQYSVILWSNRFKSDIGNTCRVSVDGTDFQIYQWKPFWKGWFLHKFKGPGVRYEVGLCIQTGEIVWLHGPFPCGKWPDIKIFRRSLMHQLAAGEKVVADLGYRGEPNHIVTPSGEQDDITKSVRGRHETVNWQFKQWGVLHRVFRHQVSKHKDCFFAVAVMTELSLENGEPLFGVVYDENSSDKL